jgi:hypothetical protein
MPVPPHNQLRIGPLLAPLALAAAVAASWPATAQPARRAVPEALQNAPPEIDRSRPGGDPAAPLGERSGGGPTGDDILGDDEGGGPGRSVIRPPMSVDPGIRQGSVPDPTPGTTPVIPPPGMPGGDPTVVPR